MHLSSPDPVRDRVFHAALATLGRNTMDFVAGDALRAKMGTNKKWFDRPEAVRGRSLKIWRPAYDAYNPANRGQPHNRDMAFVIWQGGALFDPQRARDSLLSCLWEVDGRVFIGDQYWDKIVWATAAWQYFLATGDEPFLEIAYDATRNTLVEEAGVTRPFFDTRIALETPIGNLIGHEHDPASGLFMGPETAADGRHCYPAPYHVGWERGDNILRYPEEAGVDKIRMRCVGTNALYANALAITARAGEILGRDPKEGARFARLASTVGDAIERHLWLPERNHHAYFLDEEGKPSPTRSQLGQMLAILTGVVSPEKAQQILAHTYASQWGVPRTWPIFERFDRERWEHLGGANGPIWPFVQGFAGWAASVAQAPAFLARMLEGLVGLVAGSDDCFYEAYHLLHGTPYKGWKGDLASPHAWYSPPEADQTWSASGMLALVVHGLFGVRLTETGVALAPVVPAGVAPARLQGLRVRALELDIQLAGAGTRIASCRVNGQSSAPFVAFESAGAHRIEIEMTDA